MVTFSQDFRHISPPSKELIRLALEDKIQHEKHPVLS